MHTTRAFVRLEKHQPQFSKVINPLQNVEMRMNQWPFLSSQWWTPGLCMFDKCTRDPYEWNLWKHGWQDKDQFLTRLNSRQVWPAGSFQCYSYFPWTEAPAFPLWDTCWSALLSCPHVAFLLEPFHSQLCPPGLYLILQESAYLGSLLLKKRKDFFFLNSMYGLQSEVSTNLYGKYPKRLKGTRLPGIHRTVQLSDTQKVIRGCVEVSHLASRD